jgi:hypothetical protein
MEAPHPVIRPVVIYPFVQPKNIESLRLLFEELARLGNDSLFHKPTTVVNNQTKYRSTRPWVESTALDDAYHKAINEIVAPVSTIISTWSVDTCAMWLRGLGDSFEDATDKKAHHDIFWLIPGDFDFTTTAGRGALEKLSKIPRRVYEAECDICLGEIEVPVNSAKQLIDTYGTYGLLYNWFPAEAKGIRKITDKPRTEFFAINYQALRQALIPNRWYAYEQTLMILLQNMDGDKTAREIKSESLGLITDDEATRSTLPAAMQQVERTERALKLFWRERETARGGQDWQDRFRVLDAQSESIRTAAMVILRRVLA